MRFLHLNHRYAPFRGGSERFVQEISEHLVRRGHDVQVVTTDAFDLEYFWNARRRRIDAPAVEVLNGVRVQRVAVDSRHLDTLTFPALRRGMGELARAPLPALPFEVAARALPRLPSIEATLRSTGAVDAVLATNLGLEGLALAGLSLARARDVPFILTPFTHLGRTDDVRARRFVTMPHHLKLLRGASAVVAMTRMEAAFLESASVVADRIVVSGAGVDLTEVVGGDAARFRARHDLEGVLVGSLGALAFEKGTPDLIRAIRCLRGRGVDIQLVLAGPSLGAFEGWYTALDRSEREGIHLLGYIDDDQKRDMLAAIDIFALPSRTESFGIVFLEAWANEKPVVGSDAGAVPELVQRGINGLLAPFGDVDGLARAIERLTLDHALRAALGGRGRQMAEDRYTWTHVVARVERAYELAVGHPLSGAE
jgi:glycosyltransferase involved in cell wall biosynthesis